MQKSFGPLQGRWASLSKHIIDEILFVIYSFLIKTFFLRKEKLNKILISVTQVSN